MLRGSSRAEPPPTEPSEDGPSWVAASVAWGLVLACLAAAVIGVGGTFGSGHPVPWKPLLIPVVWSVPGALVAAARPRAALGWVILTVAVLFAATGLARAWLVTGPEAGSVLTALAIWFSDRAGAVIVPVTTVALVLLPDSRLPSPRWRLPVVSAVAVQLVLVAMWSLSRTPAAAPDSGLPAALMGAPNPVGVLPAGAADTADALVWALQLPLLLAVASMVVRLRRSRGQDRARLVAPLLALAVLVAVILAGRAVWAPVADVVEVLASLLLAVVLVAAVLRRHVDGVTAVVHHAAVYTGLGGLVVAVYVVAVAVLAGLVPDVSRWGAGVVAALAALLVQPLRTRLQRGVDRMMRGESGDPFAAVSRLADQAHRAPSLGAVLGEVASSVAASLRVPAVTVEAFGSRAQHPRGADAGVVTPRGGPVRVPLTAGTREVGSVVVHPSPGRRLGRDERRLLEELGRHAGLAVDAVHLAEQVAAHHRDVVTVREEERRRLGRELHDDLGPTVAGLAMQLGALRPLVRSDPDVVVARLARLEQAATGALGSIRRVAHELRPPVLDQVGLARAVRQVAESLDLVVVTEQVDHPSLPAAVELAAYRIASEALTNVARHSGSRSVHLTLSETAGTLLVVVADEGRGPGAAGRGGPVGIGTSTMRERAEELGGTVSVRPRRPTGTVVSAMIPLGGATAVAAGHQVEEAS